jgi:glycosyltransferase involved in cell wall biosynthesis
MALEVPIGASRLDVYDGAVEHGESALLVDVDDSRGVAAAILDCLENREAARKRAQAAREQFVRYFTIEKVAQDMLGFFERALNR